MLYTIRHIIVTFQKNEHANDVATKYGTTITYPLLSVNGLIELTAEFLQRKNENIGIIKNYKNTHFIRNSNVLTFLKYKVIEEEFHS